MYPEEVLDLCREAGFAEGFAFYPGGLGNAEADRHREDRYAVLAVAPDGSSRPDAQEEGDSVPASD